MRYFQKLLCLLILVLAASFGVGGCVLLYSDFSVQRSRMAAANAAAHAQACTLLQTEILDLQRRGISTGDAALTARVTAQDVPAALWRGDTLVCATLEGLQNFPLGDAATVTVRTENSIYAVYASDLQGGLRLVTAYDLTGLYRDRNAALMRFLLLEAAVLAAASAVTALLARHRYDSVAAEGFQAPGVVVSYTTDPEIQSSKKFPENTGGCSSCGCRVIRSTTLMKRIFSSGVSSRRMAMAASISRVGTSPAAASTMSGSPGWSLQAHSHMPMPALAWLIAASISSH